MPPALSDDEMSDATDGAVTQPQLSALPKGGRKSGASSYADAASDDNMDAASSDNSTDSKKRGRESSAGRPNGSAAAAAKTDKKNAGSEDDQDVDQEDDGDGDGDEEEEYEVQEIRGHVFDKNKLRFHVIWKGYPDPADFTWEPEENLAENAADMLKEYIIKIGGREKLREKPPKGKKRGRVSSVAPTSASSNAGSATKRSRKSEEHPLNRESPIIDKPFRPPSGSWEDDVVDVEMYRSGEGELVVCLTWKGGHKTQHPAQQTYLRCPQKILRFYESHISFKTDAQ